MNENLIYWIWLQQALKYGNQRVRTVRLLYKNIKDFYTAGEKEWRLCGCFTNSQIYSMSSFTLEEAEIILKKSNKLGYKVVCIEDEKYPNLLLNIENPPSVIYVSGDISYINNNLAIAIVGTRKATEYGLNMAYDIAYNLAKNNVVVVSGGAIGVDSGAHRGAIDAGGKTISVLGCGINYPYLLKQKPLRNKISENGALISEYPPDFEPTSYTFPLRNRIISGISKGTVVVEAGAKSGSLVTANLANEQNRDVFVVPVDKNSENSKGSFGLIEDGATVVTCAEDILNEYKNRLQEYKEPLNLKSIKNISNDKKPEKEVSKLNVPEEYQDIYNILLRGKMHIDAISASLNMPIKKLNLKLVEMELLGILRACSGKTYELI